MSVIQQSNFATETKTVINLSTIGTSITEKNVAIDNSQGDLAGLATDKAYGAGTVYVFANGNTSINFKNPA